MSYYLADIKANTPAASPDRISAYIKFADFLIPLIRRGLLITLWEELSRGLVADAGPLYTW